MSFVKANNGSNGNGKKVSMTIVGKVIGYEKTENGVNAVRVEILNEGGQMHGKQAVIHLAEGDGFAKRPDISAFDPSTPKKGKIGKIPAGGTVSFDQAEISGAGKGGPEDPYVMTSRWMNNLNQNPTPVSAFVTGGLRDGKHNLTLHVIQEDAAFVVPKAALVESLSNLVLDSLKNGKNPSAILVAVDATGTATAGFSMTGTRTKDANGNWVTPQTAHDVGRVLKAAVDKQSGETLNAFTNAASILVVPGEKMPVTFQSDRGVKNVSRIAEGLNRDGGLNASRMMLSLSDPSGERQTVYVNNAVRLGGGKFDPVAVAAERLGVKMPGAEAGAEAGAGTPLVAKAEPSPDEGPAVAVTNELDDLDTAFDEGLTHKADQAVGF